MHNSLYTAILSIMIIQSFAAGMYFQERIGWANDLASKIFAGLEALLILCLGLPIGICLLLTVPFVRLYKSIDPGNQAYGWFRYHVLRKKIPATWLREFYNNNKLGPNYRRATARYRLRNIKIANRN